jgi:hypothetical protein
MVDQRSAARSFYPQSLANNIVGHVVMVLTPDENVVRSTDSPVCGVLRLTHRAGRVRGGQSAGVTSYSNRYSNPSRFRDGRWPAAIPPNPP